MFNHEKYPHLKDEVVYTLNSPYIRLHQQRRFPLHPHKKRGKEVLKLLAKDISTSTHYVLDNEFLDVLIPSIKKLSARHFVNAFWNAKPPHKKFFIEWDMGYAAKKLDWTDPPLSYKAGVSSIEKPCRKVTFCINKEQARTMNVAKESEAEVRMVPIGKMEEATVPASTELIFFQETGLQEILTENEGRYIETDDKKIPIDSNNREFRKLVQKTGEIKMCPQTMSIFNIDENNDPIARESVSHPQIIKDWFDIKNDVDFRKSGLADVSSYIGMTCHISADAKKVTKNALEAKTILEGHEFVSLLIYCGAVSLLNYDWVVEEEEGILGKGTKSVNTNTLRKDVYKRITINLPKNKAIAAFNKQKARTRAFGTAEHSVRGHWRFYKKTGVRIWIDEHKRGDAKYGTVHKDYTLTKSDDYLKTQKKKAA